MKIRNNIKRILCLALCLSMALGMLVMLSSCNLFNKGEKEDEENETLPKEEQQEGEVAVVKVLTDIEAGQKLTAENIGIGYAKETDIPINAVRDTAKVLDKYATSKLYAGEFVFQGKLSKEDPNANKNNTQTQDKGTSYIVVTEHLEEGADAAATVQKLIDKNPGKTLYFPDGTYTFSKPVKTSADPAKSVSFRLSNYAVITVASGWSSSDAIIRIGAGTEPTNQDDPTTSAYFMGGIIDGKGKAKGISVDGGRDILISNVSFKNVACAITLNAGSTGVTNTDIDNVNIVGAGSDSATGIVVKSAGNTMTNVRIRDVKTGVEASGSENVFRNVHVVYTGSSNNACGFADTSEGNSYDMCFSQNFPVGYSMGTNTVSRYSGCLAFWDAASSQQWAFKADGQFKSVIRNCRADFDFSGCNGAYLKVTSSGGAGQILWPIINGNSNIVVKDHNSYLKSHAITN